MALSAYLRLTGETQGEIKGSVTQRGREDSIEVIGSSHLMSAPRDPASGLPRGKRQHNPFVIIKNVDKSSPLIYQLLTQNENITEWKIDYWRPSSSGKEEQFYSVELVNASVAKIEFEQLNNKYPENMPHAERESIHFCYQKIIWTWVDGGITAEDDWEAPVA
jgi:type VI secretion system secreted protein Hcp